MKYSFANEGQILDSYAFEGISKIVEKSTIRDAESGFPMAIPSIIWKDRLFINFLFQMTNSPNKTDFVDPTILIQSRVVVIIPGRGHSVK